jgi:hypothetical protein
VLPKNAPEGERSGSALGSALPECSPWERDSGAGSRGGGAPPQHRDNILTSLLACARIKDTQDKEINT